MLCIYICMRSRFVRNRNCYTFRWRRLISRATNFFLVTINCGTRQTTSYERIRRLGWYNIKYVLFTYDCYVFWVIFRATYFKQALVLLQALFTVWISVNDSQIHNIELFFTESEPSSSLIIQYSLERIFFTEMR